MQKITESEVYYRKVLKQWRENYLKSEMIQMDSLGIQRVDIARGERHFNFTRLCDVVYVDILDHELSGKNFKSNLKRIDQNKRNVEYANELIEKLQVKASIEIMLQDFLTTRRLIKKTFQQFFSVHGVILDSRMIDAIFGTIQDPQNPNKEIDSIKQYTIGTSLNYDLRYQFGLTKGFCGNGIFSIFFMRASGLSPIHGFGYNPISEDSTKYIKNLSPLYSEMKIMRVLIKAALSIYL